MIDSKGLSGLFCCTIGAILLVGCEQQSAEMAPVGEVVSAGEVLPVAPAMPSELTAQDHWDLAVSYAQKGAAAAEQAPGYGNLCLLDMEFRNVNPDYPGRGEDAPIPDVAFSIPEDFSLPEFVQGGGEGEPEPMQVFDNLYFVGSRAVSAWVIGDEDGYILTDAMTSNADSDVFILAGMEKLGIDPQKVQYLVLPHAHGDHFGGHERLTEVFAPRIVMSEIDWRLSEILPEHPRFGLPPAKDIAINNGDVLTVGNTSITLYVGPGHTMGTISPVFTVYDDGVPHKALLWGGTGFNFGRYEPQLRGYAETTADYRQMAVDEDIEVLLSNHGARDNSILRMEQLAARSEGELHPFVDREVVLATLDTLHNCALAQAERLAAERKLVTQ